MSGVEINLLPNKNVESAVFTTRLKILRLIAVSSLFLISALSIVFFLLITFSALPQEKQKQAAALEELSVYYSKMGKVIGIHDRIEETRKTLASRRQISPIIDRLVTQVPIGASVDKITIKGKTVVFGISSQSLSTIDTFINNLLELAQKKEFISHLTLSSFSFNDQKGAYSAEIQMNLL